MLCDFAGHHSFIEGDGELTSIIKSISLDPQTAELASNLPNFSRFVRECLIRYHIEDGGEWALCKRKEGERMCYPRKKPRCMKCWPAGPPAPEHWSEYVRQPRTHDPYGKPLGQYVRTVNPNYHNDEWVTARAVEDNPPLFSFKDIQVKGNAKPSQAPRSRSFRSRFISAIRSFSAK